jgi:hypothetical protein
MTSESGGTSALKTGLPEPAVFAMPSDVDVERLAEFIERSIERGLDEANLHIKRT